MAQVICDDRLSCPMIYLRHLQLHRNTACKPAVFGCRTTLTLHKASPQYACCLHSRPARQAWQHCGNGSHCLLLQLRCSTRLTLWTLQVTCYLACVCMTAACRLQQYSGSAYTQLSILQHTKQGSTRWTIIRAAYRLRCCVPVSNTMSVRLCNAV